MIKVLLLSSLLLLGTIGYFSLEDDMNRNPNQQIENQKDSAYDINIAEIDKMTLGRHDDTVAINNEDWSVILKALKESIFLENTQQNPLFYYYIKIEMKNGQVYFCGIYEANPDEFRLIFNSKLFNNPGIYLLLEPYERKIQEEYFSTPADLKKRGITRVPKIRLGK